MDQSRGKIIGRSLENYHLSEQLYISSWSIISKAAIYKNGQELFRGASGSEPAVFLQDAYKALECSYPKFYKMDNLSKLGWLAAEVLVHINEEAGTRLMNDPLFDPASVAVLLCNSSSSLDTDLKYYQTVDQVASPALFVYTLPNIVIGEICIRNGWKGENAFFIAEKFESGMLEEQVKLMMTDPNNKTCICGWLELFGHEYRATLFAVEKKDMGANILFSERNIELIFNNPEEQFLKKQLS